MVYLISCLKSVTNINLIVYVYISFLTEKFTFLNKAFDDNVKLSEKVVSGIRKVGRELNAHSHPQ